MALGGEIRLTRIVPGALAGAMVRELLLKVHEENFRGLPYEFDIATYPEKLARLAEGVVARDKDDMIRGFVFGYANDRESGIAYISYIARFADGGKGLGLELHRAFCELAAERELATVRLEVLKTNLRAQAFYRRLGYAPIEDRGNRYLMELSWKRA